MTWPNTSQQDFEDLVFAHVTQLNGLEWTSKFFSLRIRMQLEDGGTKFGKFKIDQMKVPDFRTHICFGLPTVYILANSAPPPGGEISILEKWGRNKLLTQKLLMQNRGILPKLYCFKVNFQ